MRAEVAIKFIAACLFAVALATAVIQARNAIGGPGAGFDFSPLRHAGEMLRTGQSIYSDAAFVYPPTAAVAFVPFTLVSYVAALHFWIAVSTAAVFLAAFASVAPWRGQIWWPVAAISAGLLMKSDVLSDSLWLGNASLLLAPVAVAILFLFENRRWRIGCALLMASLLFKPLLLPLLFVPLLRRQWRPVLITAAPAAVLLVAAVVIIPGGSHFFSVLRFIEEGSGLNGRQAVYNLSVRGVAERLDFPTAGLTARLVVTAFVLAVIVRWARKSRSSDGTAASGTLLLIGVLLVGSQSQIHYLVIVAPCLLVALALQTRFLPFACAIPGLVLMFIPRYYVGHIGHSSETLQLRYFVAQVFLAVAAAAAVWQASDAAEDQSSVERVAPTLSAPLELESE